ncbi:MAG: co-chaperone GroES [Clostridiales bacterium]|nr:co-chaperone GroES [Clostridiales bacterium]
MNVKPLFDYLVVDAKEKQETTKSGFILTSASADKYTTATVLAVGLGGNLYGKDIVMQVKKGDTVLFSADAVTKAKVDGEEISIIRQSDVIAIIE